MTDDVVIEGYEGKEYTTEAKTFEGYELTSTPEDAKGKMKVTEDEDGNKTQNPDRAKEDTKNISNGTYTGLSK